MNLAYGFFMYLDIKVFVLYPRKWHADTFMYKIYVCTRKEREEKSYKCIGQCLAVLTMAHK